MELSLVTLLAAALFFGVLAIFGATQTRGPTDVVLVFLLMYSLFYGLRPLLFVLGLDVPEPEGFFDPATVATVLTVTIVGVTIFLAAALAGVVIFTGSGLRGWGPFFVSGRVSMRRSVRLTAGVTLLATLISGYLVVHFGGVGSLVTAAKFDQALAGLFVLRIAPALGAILAVGTFLEAYARRERLVVLVFGLVCAVLNACYVFLWGSRSVLVVIGAAIVLGLHRRSRARAAQRPARRPVVLRLLVAAVLVVAVAGGLRMVRDQLINGQVQAVYADAGTWRQVSLGTNAVYFDAAMLAFRDWPSQHAFRNGEDFKVGALGVVPRSIWPGKPQDVAPGSWFRQVYQPEKVNGWPMGAAALWYLNFGWPGLLLGGLLSGLVIGAVSAAQRRKPDNGFNSAAGVAIGVFVIALGVESGWLVSAVTWLVPLWLAARYLSIPDRSDSPSSLSTPTTIPARYYEQSTP